MASHAGIDEYYVFMEFDAALFLRNSPTFQLNRAVTTINSHSPFFPWSCCTDVSSLFAILCKNVTHFGSATDDNVKYIPIVFSLLLRQGT